jgi:integrase
MRKSEILNLTWDNVDLKNGLILLEKTKNGERREIPMNEPLKQLFRQLFSRRRLDTEYVFVNPETGKRYIDLKRSFATACKKSGIRDFHFHDLRHTFASQLVMNGVDLKTVQELLGHKDIKMTLRYSHLSQAHKKEAVNKITGFLKITRKQGKI